jgi:hypothetical protein
VLALGSGTIGKPVLSRNLVGRGIDLAPPQRLDEIARKNNPASLPARQALARQMVGTTLHRLANLGAETAPAGRGIAGDELAVSGDQPSRS